MSAAKGVTSSDLFGVESEVMAELARATTKFPLWPTDPLHAFAVGGEECAGRASVRDHGGGGFAGGGGAAVVTGLLQRAVQGRPELATGGGVCGWHPQGGGGDFLRGRSGVCAAGGGPCGSDGPAGVCASVDGAGRCGSWMGNPLVWRVEFERVEGGRS